MTNQLLNIRNEIKRYHRLIQKADGIQKDIYIEEMNNLIEKREEMERGIEVLTNPDNTKYNEL